MSLSDCPKCWSTPCMCGHEYQRWTTADLEELHGILGAFLDKRAAKAGHRGCKKCRDAKAHNILAHRPPCDGMDP